MWDAGGLGRKMSPERKDRQRKQTYFQDTSDARLVAISGLNEYEEHTRRSKSTTGIRLNRYDGVRGTIHSPKELEARDVSLARSEVSGNTYEAVLPSTPY